MVFFLHYGKDHIPHVPIVFSLLQNTKGPLNERSQGLQGKRVLSDMILCWSICIHVFLTCLRYHAVVSCSWNFDKLRSILDPCNIQCIFAPRLAYKTVALHENVKSKEAKNFNKLIKEELRLRATTKEQWILVQVLVLRHTKAHLALDIHPANRQLECFVIQNHLDATGKKR